LCSGERLKQTRHQQGWPRAYACASCEQCISVISMMFACWLHDTSAEVVPNRSSALSCANCCSPAVACELGGLCITDLLLQIIIEVCNRGAQEHSKPMWRQSLQQLLSQQQMLHSPVQEHRMPDYRATRLGHSHALLDANN
jgi:hypothetical protein